MPKLIGQAIPRREDRRFITGTGRYTDDVRLPNTAYAYVVRSPYPHARIRAIDPSAAAAAPGVLAVLTATDYLADGHGPIVHAPNSADAINWQKPAFIPAPGEPPVADVPQLPLAHDRARFIGEGVALVVAETAAQARDAAELVEVDYEAIDAVFDIAAALALGAPEVHAAVPGNLCFDVPFGDAAAVERIFAEAPLVLEREFPNQRVFSAHMEPRAALATYDPGTGVYTLIAGNQGAHRYRTTVAATLGIPQDQLHVVSPDVGGAFGSRTNIHPEPVLITWAARRLGRPVRWTSDRSEGFSTDYQGRDITPKVAIAFDRDGKILAYRGVMIGNVGAYTVGYAPLQNVYRVSPSAYHIPVAAYRIRAVLTNTTSTAPFRGAGRPEAIHALERLLDLAARQLGIERAEIRRRNLIRREQLPYVTASGLTYDAGDFQGNFERVLELADYAGFPARRTADESRGRLRGIGLANYVETPVGQVRERVVVRVFPDDAVEVIVGTQSSGQGHETTFAQVAAEVLDVPFESVRIAYGDTEAISSGGGTHSNRSMRIVGTLLVQTCTELRERAAPLDVFSAARAAGEPIETSADFAGRIHAYPTGSTVVELSIDPATGEVKIERFTQVDDPGQPINPLILHGQTHGGIAMAIGQALFETLAPDLESGTTPSSFMTYAIAHATDVPFYKTELREDPTASNPLRIKGGGEGGVVPGTAAIINAIVDALRDYGVDHIDTPATSERIWQAIHGAPSPRNFA